MGEDRHDGLRCHSGDGWLRAMMYAVVAAEAPSREQRDIQVGQVSRARSSQEFMCNR